jgi:hypothetical protein
MEQFEVVYVSSACNRTPHNADWGTNKLICYGASHSVVLYEHKVRSNLFWSVLIIVQVTFI